jgi:polysaccharide pyruvyl transferase WcaK-like protein
VTSYDLVLFAGGGNLNVYWPELIAWRTAIAAAAKAGGVPYVLTGQGVGPLSDEIIPMLSFLAREAVAVATRDSDSARLWREIVRDGSRIDIVGDDALGLRCEEPSIARDRLKEIGVPVERPLLAFHAREAPYVGFSRDDLRNTARHVDRFAAENGYTVLGVPINMHPAGPDAELLSDLAQSERRQASWHIVDVAGDIAALAGVIKVCAAVLTHSFHVAIFALENRIPTLVFAGTEYYERKAEALRTAFGIPVSIAARCDMDASTIADMLRQVRKSPGTQPVTSAQVDASLDAKLPRRPERKTGASIAHFGNWHLGITG